MNRKTAKSYKKKPGLFASILIILLIAAVIVGAGAVVLYRSGYRYIKVRVNDGLYV